MFDLDLYEPEDINMNTQSLSREMNTIIFRRIVTLAIVSMGSYPQAGLHRLSLISSEGISPVILVIVSVQLEFSRISLDILTSLYSRRFILIYQLLLRLYRFDLLVRYGISITFT